MTTATAILILAGAIVATNAWGWYVAFPWQMRWMHRDRARRFPWSVEDLNRKDDAQ